MSFMVAPLTVVPSFELAVQAVELDAAERVASNKGAGIVCLSGVAR